MAEATSTSVESVEQWKPVVGHEGLYEVSDQGRVRSVAIFHYRAKQACVRKTPLPMRLQKTRKGYIRVQLRSVVHGPRRVGVHRLVMAAFVGSCPPEMQVNHKDGNKGNNHLSNLEYVTQSDNLLHAYRTGLAKARVLKGSANPFSKLTEQGVRDIRRLAAEGWRVGTIGAHFNVTHATICAILAGKTWKHVA